MIYYYKTNHLVAEMLQVTDVRLLLSDGNYILWQADITHLAMMLETDVPDAVLQAGALGLTPREARQEQDGTICRELPTPTNPIFIEEEES